MSFEPHAAAEALRQLRKTLESTKGELGNMPFFVRPMVKKGFERRTGRSMDGWLERIAELIMAMEAGSIDSALALRSRDPRLADDLAALADHFRTAPERAKRGMSGPALDAVAKRSADRERTVVATRAALGL